MPRIYGNSEEPVAGTPDGEASTLRTLRRGGPPVAVAAAFVLFLGFMYSHQPGGASTTALDAAGRSEQATNAFAWMTQQSSEVDQAQQQHQSEAAEQQSGAAASKATPTHAASVKHVTNITFNKPHILFFLVDDQGFNDIGYNSNDLEGASPTIDAMALSGVRMSNYYAQHLCTPSRAALMTSVLPMHMGLQHEVILPSAPWGVPLKYKMLPAYLEDKGYKTHLIGKWHLGFFMDEYLPTKRGFHTFYGYLSDQENYYDRTYPFPIGNKYYQDFMYLSDENQNAQFIDLTGNYSLDLITARTVDIIQEHDLPFPTFMYVAFQTLHGPLEAPPDHMIDDKQVLLLNDIPNEQRKKFARMLMATDHSIKTIMNEIERKGWSDDTLVIYSSDNGACHFAGGYNSPLRGGKHYLFEGGVRVHGFLYSRQLLHTHLAGTEFKGLMHISDWLPTILSAIGHSGSIPKDIDGIDQWAAIQGTVSAPREILMHNYDAWTTKTNGTEEFLAPLAGARGAVRVGHMKLIANEYALPWYSPRQVDVENEEDTSEEDFMYLQDCEHTPNDGINTFLFNITEDPNETTDLKNEHPELVEEMSALMHALAWRVVAPEWKKEDNSAVRVWNRNGFFCPWRATESGASYTFSKASNAETAHAMHQTLEQAGDYYQ